MQYKKLIDSEIDFNNAFRYITRAYEEIAVMKMRKVRTSVIATRDYLSNLADVFFELKKAKEKQKQANSQLPVVSSQSKTNTIKTDNRQPTTEKLSKKVSVLLSANTTLYGDLIERIFYLFLKNVSQDNSDIIIVGRVGKRLYDQQMSKKPYIYFELPDFDINLEALKPVIFHMVKYKEIQVYYAKFESMLNQKETSSSISGDRPYGFEEMKRETRNENGNEKQSTINNQQLTISSQFLFEPDLDKILSFFQDLIASSLFRQTVHETQLARWASRILSMEKAQANIDLSIKKLHFSRSKINKQEENQRQLSRLAGLSLWRK